MQWDAVSGCRTQSWQLSVSSNPSGSALLLRLELYASSPESTNLSTEPKLVETVVLGFPSSGDANALWQGRTQKNDSSASTGAVNIGADVLSLEPGEGIRRWCGHDEQWSSSKGNVAQLCAQISNPMLLMLRVLRSELATHVATLSRAKDCNNLQRWVLQVISTADNAKSSPSPQMVSKNAKTLSEHEVPSKPPLQTTESPTSEKDDFWKSFPSLIQMGLITFCIVTMAQLFCLVARTFK